MPRYFLTRLEIEGFRGINNDNNPLVLSFKHDAVNSIWAPNAFGKSSIYEALFYAIRGTIPKLEGLPASDDPSAYYCNRFHSRQTAKIVITLTPDDSTSPIVQIEVQRLPDGSRRVSSPSGHADPEAMLKSLDNDLVLLDYKTFQKFIEDSPLQRGRSMASLVGLGQLSELRQALQVLANARNIETDFGVSSVESALTAIKVRTRQALLGIKSCYEELVGASPKEPFDPKDVVAKATSVLRQVPLLAQFFETADITSVDFDLIRSEIRKAEKGDERDRLATLVNQIEGIQALAPCPTEAEQHERLERWIVARNKALLRTRGPLLNRLYTVALEVLRSGQWIDPRQCPACESRLDDPLEPQIMARAMAYRRVRCCEEGIRRCLATATWIERLRSLESLEALGVKPEDRKHPEIRTRLFADSIDVEHVKAAVSTLRTLDTIRTARLDALEVERRTLEATIPPSLVALTEKATYGTQLATSLASLQQTAAESAEQETTIKRIRLWKAFIEYAYAAFSAAEVSLSSAKTTAIETRYRDFYASITRTSQIMPVLRKAAGTQELYLCLERFYGLTDVAANPLLSESYRNALALSVYLAAVLETTCAGRFLVLDDVTSSFDAGHQWSLMELLRERFALPANASGPQVILLSHDGLLEKYFDTFSRYPVWHHQRLTGSPPNGHILTQPQQAERLRVLATDYLDAGRVAEAKPLIRQYLEYKLMQIIRRLDIPVPLDFAIRDDRRMVSECLEAISAAVKLHSRADDLVLMPEQVTALLSIHLPALVGNWISHYETAVATSLRPEVLRSLLDRVDNFVDCFQYDCKCGPPRRRFYENLTRKACNC